MITDNNSQKKPMNDDSFILCTWISRLWLFSTILICANKNIALTSGNKLFRYIYWFFVQMPLYWKWKQLLQSNQIKVKSIAKWNKSKDCYWVICGRISKFSEVATVKFNMRWLYLFNWISLASTYEIFQFHNLQIINYWQHLIRNIHNEN